MREGGSKLAHDRLDAADLRPSAQILPFRPREGLTDHPAAKLAPADDPESEFPDDLTPYEQDRPDEDEHINYPQRMLMNMIAVVVVAILIGLGVWLADSITAMERNQDCLLQGRQNCAPLEIAAPLPR
ncbi:MAG: hypothetical protein ACRECV_03465 [Xanthobacteraceae bacterium]